MTCDRERVSVRGRYAPSPTGRLHLGNARTALIAWLSARAQRGAFVLRVEDLDPGRSRREHEARQIEDLRWLGLDWDEGPDVGGSYGPYRQSERGDRYAEAMARLSTFACVCTRRELREATLAPHGSEPIYPGTCRERAIDPSVPAAVRWRVPAGVIRLTDRVCGSIAQDVAMEVGDFVLRRADGAWAYQLACVVDDAEMAITEVVRGADLIDSVARQVALARALGHPVPAFAHVPLVRGPDGDKLSKRHGAPDLSTLREGGADPAIVVAVLARSAGLLPAHVTAVTPHELVADFALERVRETASDRLDPTALR